VEGDPVGSLDSSGSYIESLGSGYCTVGTGEYEEIVECDFFTTVYSQPIKVGDIGGGTLLDEWDNLSDKCKRGLMAARKGPDNDQADPLRVQALNRAWAAESTLAAATDGTDISWTMLAAIGIRESGFQNINQPDGNGHGAFQIDTGKNPAVSPQQAMNLSWAAGWATNLLATNMSALAREFPNFDASQLLQATAASYNFGTTNISGNPNTIDVGTTNNNYGSNILDLMDCFK
jgi:hypothetical protein